MPLYEICELHTHRDEGSSKSSQHNDTAAAATDRLQQVRDMEGGGNNTHYIQRSVIQECRHVNYAY